MPALTNPLDAPYFCAVDDSTWAFSLVASLPQRGLFLYSNYDEMTLWYNGYTLIFPWHTPGHTGVVPELLYVGTVGEKSTYAFIIFAGRGTGTSVQNLHLIELRVQDGELLYNKSSLMGHEASLWFDNPLVAMPYQGGPAIEILFNGASYVICWFYRTDAEWLEGDFVRLAYGHLVGFDIADGAIAVSVGIGALYESLAMPFFLGRVSAEVLFDNTGFRFANHDFEPFTMN